ncbi:hypothetical protein A2V82_09445 [candidate division KSB1 bacterium RBG_16_48_16]|nr:MAG: hypothetical protein A2V82_09445 [candidate division KSB1 bacterium RBG_16_48_16]
MFPSKFSVSIIVLLCTAISPCFSDSWSADPFVDMAAEEESSWTSFSFELKDRVDVLVDATGTFYNDDWIARAWILDSDSRRLVWEMTEDNSKKSGRKGKRRFYDELNLPRGRYEAYFSTNHITDIHIEGLSDVIDGIFRGFNYKSRFDKDWGISIYLPKDKTDLYAPFDAEGGTNEIVRLTEVENDEHVKAGFSVNKEIAVRVYSVCEGRTKSREMYDYGWIIDADTRQQVWQADIRKSENAGGSAKNRLFDETLTLKPGNYVVHFITDDSHSFEEFNQMPPYDLRHWGITLWVQSGDFQDVEITPYEESEPEAVVNLTGVGDEEFVSAGFTLAQNTKFRVYALGEQPHSNREFVDYGWIENAGTKEVVWKMTEENSTHAGGGNKNRVADQVIELPAGNYMVYYITDDSHSYDEWNAGPPIDPERWGITLWLADSTLSSDVVQPYTEEDDPSILAKITKVGDDEHLHKTFTLKEARAVRVFALGEGDRDEMYDYGWIEDRDGEVIWEMHYENTSHAGGARKNRLVNETIELDAGTYEVFYSSDGSHSFAEWNATPPGNPADWGITISLE